ICVDPYLRPHPHTFAPAGKLLEYMACGACVITPKGFFNQELITDGQSGLVIDGSKEDLKAKLLYLLQDRTRINRFAAEAREAISRNQKTVNRPEELERYLMNIVKR